MTAPDLGAGLAFLGGGHMARALVAALHRSGVAGASLHVIEPDVQRREALRRDYDITPHADATQLPRLDTLLLAVKPQDLETALPPLQDWLARHRPLVISVAAGVTIARLARLCPAGSIVRAMPNRGALVGAGATGLYAPPGIDPLLRTRATAILGTAGIVVTVEEESLMDVVTAVSGSGPAYFFALAEALAKAGVLAGLPADAAESLARATLSGAGALTSGDSSLAALRASVTSKGGTTAAALEALDRRSFEELVREAVEAAVRRGREIGG
ncbi:MAG: pyrroline-5-carboxylate reductase [Steroidobacteraceae bacterium]